VKTDALIRCACDDCGMHVATRIEELAPEGCCPGCGWPVLTPVMGPAQELEFIPPTSTLSRAVHSPHSPVHAGLARQGAGAPAEPVPQSGRTLASRLGMAAFGEPALESAHPS